MVTNIGHPRYVVPLQACILAVANCFLDKLHLEGERKRIKDEYHDNSDRSYNSLSAAS